MVPLNSSLTKGKKRACCEFERNKFYPILYQTLFICFYIDKYQIVIWTIGFDPLFFAIIEAG